ncbi:MAG: hypothetical protein DI536_01420 [Archangium gephyra]|uniref:NHL repeat containing protein n=1 Tax=Archangium gephyra TaxID=48 RepID=A0A2W5TWR0_9BACT|nr:MAG: hypothetical protein DI536_01420 [Archangium gephyra]
MHGRTRVGVAVAAFSVLAFAGCAPQDELSQNELSAPESTIATTTTETSSSSSEALRIDLNPNAIAYDYFNSTHVPHGITGDEEFVFVTQPLSGRVSVVDRLLGREIATLTPPPGGWLLPFALRMTDDGKLAVLDAGGFPNPNIPSVARIYEYEFRRNRRTRKFEANLTRTISFAGLPIIFAEDLEVLPGGRYVLSESVIGALWVVNADGSIAPGIMPDSLAPGAAVPKLAGCAFTPVVIGGVPFSTAGNFAPGVGALAVRNGQLYLGSSCRGGVARVPVASLTDPTRSPEQRGNDIVDVSPRPIGTASEALKGFAFNKWNNDNRLYVTDTIGRRVLRINLTTGAREVLADDAQLFDFPVAAAFLPPVAGVSPLVVASDQEYRLAALNPLITEDLLHPPFVVAKIYVVR